MADISHADARSFARKVAKEAKREDAANLARAYLQLRELLDDAHSIPRSVARALGEAPELARRTVTVNGFTGYIEETSSGRFTARLRGDPRQIHLGTFDTDGQAEAAIGKGWSGRIVDSKTNPAARSLAAIRQARAPRCTFVIRKGNAPGAECGAPGSGVPPRCGRHTPERLEQMTGRKFDADGNVERGTGG